jgi:hypothetical protein
MRQRCRHLPVISAARGALNRNRTQHRSTTDCLPSGRQASEAADLGRGRAHGGDGLSRVANRRLAGRRIVPKVRVVDRHVIVALPLGPQRLEVPASPA